MISILIVEDELIIAEDMSNILTGQGYQVTGIAMDAFEAVELLNAQRPDLVLLDINLSGKTDGIMLAEKINQTYGVPFIFTTSYTDGPTVERAKKVNPLNYLVKPFKPEQLFTTIELAMYNLAKRESTESSQPMNGDVLLIKQAIFIKDRYRYTKIGFDEIRWIKSEGNYLELHLDGKKEIIRGTLSALLLQLSAANFFRTHKSYAINLNYLTKLEPNSVTISKTEVPITKPFADELIKRLNIV
jgi:DNA-binding LytR/AlgR family response regulator